MEDDDPGAALVCDSQADLGALHTTAEDEPGSTQHSVEPPERPLDLPADEANLPFASPSVVGVADKGVAAQGGKDTSASAADVPSAIQFVVQCIANAGKSHQTQEAIEHMQLALSHCAGRESEHPALSVEAARVRLGLGSLLIAVGRQTEAAALLAEAEKLLAAVLAWTATCDPGEDPTVDAIETEARSLQRAAQETSGSGGSTGSTSKPSGLSLPPLARLTSCDSEVPIPRDGVACNSAQPSRGQRRNASRERGKVGSRGRKHGSQHAHGDVFAEYVRCVEADKDARRYSTRDHQGDDRKRLGQVHKQTRLMLDLTGDDELKQKRYSSNGHRVMMQSMMAGNRSLSDPSLQREARKAGIYPELAQLKKLNRQLYVKPPTPPPVKKEKVFAGAAHLAELGFGRMHTP